VQLQWISTQDAVVKVQVLNAAGETVVYQSYDAMRGLNQVMMNMQNLDSGMYIIHINTDADVHVMKWMKIRL